MEKVNSFILSEINIEIKKARKKFPPFHSDHEAYGVIKE